MLCTVFLVSVTVQNISAYVTYLNHRDIALGFSIDYPETWILKEKNRFDFRNNVNLTILNPGTSKLYVAENDGRVFVSFFNTSASPTKPNLSSLTKDVHDRRPLLVKSKDCSIKEVEPINTSKYVINGEQSASYLYAINCPDLTYAEQSIVTTHNGVFYDFEFGAGGDIFDNPEMAQIREHMINSIRWLK